jgi:Rrf2 family protein
MVAITQKTKYALKALIFLTKEKDRGPVLISEISERERIPRKFLELILLELKNQGILQSKMGKGGGYYLSRPPEAIYLGSVIRIFDGALAPLPCASKRYYRKCEECLDETTCEIRRVMLEVKAAILKVLDTTSVADTLKNKTLELTD